MFLRCPVFARINLHHWEPVWTTASGEVGRDPVTAGELAKCDPQASSFISVSVIDAFLRILSREDLDKRGYVRPLATSHMSDNWIDNLAAEKNGTLPEDGFGSFYTRKYHSNDAAGRAELALRTGRERRKLNVDLLKTTALPIGCHDKSHFAIAVIVRDQHAVLYADSLSGGQGGEEVREGRAPWSNKEGRSDPVSARELVQGFLAHRRSAPPGTLATEAQWRWMYVATPNQTGCECAARTLTTATLFVRHPEIAMAPGFDGLAFLRDPDLEGLALRFVIIALLEDRIPPMHLDRAEAVAPAAAAAAAAHSPSSPSPSPHPHGSVNPSFLTPKPRRGTGMGTPRPPSSQRSVADMLKPRSSHVEQAETRAKRAKLNADGAGARTLGTSQQRAASALKQRRLALSRQRRRNGGESAPDSAPSAPRGSDESDDDRTSLAPMSDSDDDDGTDTGESDESSPVAMSDVDDDGGTGTGESDEASLDVMSEVDGAEGACSDDMEVMEATSSAAAGAGISQASSAGSTAVREAGLADVKLTRAEKKRRADAQYHEKRRLQKKKGR